MMNVDAGERYGIQKIDLVYEDLGALSVSSAEDAKTKRLWSCFPVKNGSISSIYIRQVGFSLFTI